MTSPGHDRGVHLGLYLRRDGLLVHRRATHDLRGLFLLILVHVKRGRIGARLGSTREQSAEATQDEPSVRHGCTVQ